MTDLRHRLCLGGKAGGADILDVTSRSLVAEVLETIQKWRTAKADPHHRHITNVIAAFLLLVLLSSS